MFKHLLGVETHLQLSQRLRARGVQARHCARMVALRSAQRIDVEAAAREGHAETPEQRHSKAPFGQQHLRPLC